MDEMTYRRTHVTYIRINRKNPPTPIHFLIAIGLNCCEPLCGLSLLHPSNNARACTFDILTRPGWACFLAPFMLLLRLAWVWDQGLMGSRLLLGREACEEKKH